MILTLQDDGVLRVYKSVDDAVGDVEALDAEETFQAVFDDSGETYAIHWIRPDKRGRVFRFLVSNGAYTLVPKNVKDCERHSRTFERDPRSAGCRTRRCAGSASRARTTAHDVTL